MKVLVTGGAGFIGSHIVDELLRRNREVRVIDNFSTGKWVNVQHLRPDVEIIEGDIRDEETVKRAIHGVELVYHQAALPSVPRSIIDPVTSTAVNVLGTTILLKAAVDAGVRRVVYAASSSAYGNSGAKIKSETLMPNPLSPYAVTKLSGEYMLLAFARCYSLETVGLRYFNVFGERQDPQSQYSGVIAKFCLMMLTGQQPIIYGDGSTSRDFTYVRNVVEANMLAGEVPGINGRVMNVACGGNITLNGLVSTINRVLDTHLEPLYGPERAGDVKRSCADVRLARELLGYRPSVDFEAGLQRTIDWYKATFVAQGV